MEKKNQTSFNTWFSEYCKSFHFSDPGDQKNIRLQEEHTAHVCRNIIKIGLEVPLRPNELLLAETVALFHDVGRFPQYKRYRTFRDSESENHGALGAKTLESQHVLGVLPEAEQRLILQAVKYHNAFKLPSGQTDDTIFFLKMIRDADKLDIWRVFIEYYESSEIERASAVALGFPDLPGYSDEVLAFIYNRQIAPLAKAGTLNDYKLVQLSWVFDLNFVTSFMILEERKYIVRIASHLPDTEDIRNVVTFLKGYVQEKLLTGRHERAYPFS